MFMEDLERLNARVTFLWWTVLFAVAFGTMLRLASHKAIVIADSGHGQVAQDGEAGDAFYGQNEMPGNKLALQAGQGAEGYFEIPLEKGVRAEDVTLENCYMDREVHIYLQRTSPGFYESCALQGDISHIVAAGWEAQDGGILLRIRTDDVLEYKTSMENGMLKMETCIPRDMYRMIAVIDPAGGTDREAQEIALQVGRFVREKWDDGSVKIYFTRTDGPEIPERQKTDFVEAVRADLFVQIALDESDDADSYGIRGRYNDLYFIPGFGNVQLADILVRNVTVAGQNRALGVQPAQEGDILQEIRVPAAQIALGFLTNEKERELLGQEIYQEKLAEGIVKAIGEVYESYYE